MFPNPDQLDQLTPGEVLEAAARGHLGRDHRFLHALVDRREQALPAALQFAQRDLDEFPIDLSLDLVVLFHYWKAPEAIPFLIRLLKEDPEDAPDDLMAALAGFGAAALDPLLELYDEVDVSEVGNLALLLGSLGVRDDRILQRLLQLLDHAPTDALFGLSVYGDPAAIPGIERAAAGQDDPELQEEFKDTLAILRDRSLTTDHAVEAPDIWEMFPEKEDLPIQDLDEDTRMELLGHSLASVRAAAAKSFFNEELAAEETARLLEVAGSDSEASVRAHAWEALMNSTEESAVLEAMLAALRRPELPLEERGGLLVGLAPEGDRDEVRQAMLELYQTPGGKAKALEAMWRSVHPSFRDYFPRHLDDPDLEIRRGAVWGVGYYRLKSELERVRKLFDDDDLRSDALFAYALALPGEPSRGRVKGLLDRIEKDARGFSEMEEELVKMALNERLLLAGKEPVFWQQED